MRSAQSLRLGIRLATSLYTREALVRCKYAEKRNLLSEVPFSLGNLYRVRNTQCRLANDVDRCDSAALVQNTNVRISSQIRSSANLNFTVGGVNDVDRNVLDVVSNGAAIELQCSVDAGSNSLLSNTILSLCRLLP